jgi:hypothetical protein
MENGFSLPVDEANSSIAVNIDQAAGKATDNGRCC